LKHDPDQVVRDFGSDLGGRMVTLSGNAPNVLGYNGRGVAMSAAMGPQIAQRVIGGRRAEIDMPVTTMREIPSHAPWRSAVSARMIYSPVQARIGR